MLASNVMSWSWKPTGRCRFPDDPFFDEGNLVCRLHYHKRTCIDDDTAVDHPGQSKSEFMCHLPNCNKTFASVAAYEVHYNSAHRNCCALCLRSFPNQHLLDLHLLERHDQMFYLAAAKKPMFRCLLENCPVVSGSCKERKEHLISVHKYPPNFRFIDLSRRQKKSSKDSKLSAPNSLSATTGVNIRETGTAVVEEMETEEHKDSPGTTLRKFQPRVPKNISFGHGVARGFHRPAANASRGKRNNPWQHKRKAETETNVSIENVRMDDLAEVLSSSYGELAD